MPAESRKEKVAVIGGGMGGLSAAFYLTEEPNWSDKYDITVYQQGWRLGGKCASGRDTRPGYGDRIYEHGLHIFAGFYDQSFHLLRRAYDALERPPEHPNRSVWDAFTPSDQITLVEPARGGLPMSQWHLNVPTNERRPGDEVVVPSLLEHVHRMLELLQTMIPFATTMQPGENGSGHSKSGFLSFACKIVKRLFHRVEADVEEAAINFALHRAIDLTHKQMRLLGTSEDKTAFAIEERRFIELAFMAQTILHGIIEDRIPVHGFDALDTYEYSEWIHKNALAVAKKYPGWGHPKDRADDLVNSAIIRSGYDYAFAYDDGGDPNKPNLAAGTALRALFLMMFYKGHFFWKMRGAMGEVVIAPLYLALLKRGVKFKFFHRVTKLNIDRDTASLHSIDLVQQAQLASPDQAYQPLIDVPIEGWPEDQPLEAWPYQPLWDQLKDGEALRASGRDFEADFGDAPLDGDVAQTLMQGIDFDQVILGVPPGVSRSVCRDFPDRLPASNWGPMFKAVSVTRTCAMQLWFKRDMADLGCETPDRTLTGAEQSFSSWADMSHLLSRERWQGSASPKSIAYFCGQIPGGEPTDPPAIDIDQEARRWLKQNAPIYWPRALSETSAYSLSPSLLVNPGKTPAKDPLDGQYIKANNNPSDLYVQAPKNSVFTRMDAHESGLDNLFLAGDWTRNGINSGCAEAAVRSGLRCALAMGGKLPPLER